MSVVLLANIGQRDLLLGGQRIEPARAAAQGVLERFDECKDQLSLPMLSPLLDLVLREHEQVQVVLYGTDQPEWVGAAHRERDTVHLAEVAIRLIRLRYAGRVEWAKAKVIDGNPSLYDDMLVFFRQQLSPRQSWTREVERCYVCTVGGTPGANTGLMLAAIERFGERCETLYLPEGETRPVRMDVGEQMRRSVARRLARGQLESLSFAAAAALLEKAGAAPWTVQLARYAADRYHFDFESAEKRLESARQACSGDWAARTQCDRLREGLRRLLEGDPRTLLRELCHNAVMAWHRHEYAAFLGLVFRFQEAMLRQMVEELYEGIDTDVDEDGSAPRFREAIETRPGLLAYLRSQRINGRPLDYSRPSRLLLEAMVRYGCDHPPRGQSTLSR